MQKFYGQIIDTSESKPMVVCEVEFETEAEAKAFALGASQAALCADYEPMYGQTSEQESEDE